ncbi:M20/M25/M40 family metallo-hydrolase [Ramlibacter sp. PS4R-6]|uniref:M20/M25/M40 family metallo-hydrolase n=1 Tax=Ramlibacter sp. PS4R-6 TaxID=3133438 RepID=UPI0030A29558
MLKRILPIAGLAFASFAQAQAVALDPEIAALAQREAPAVLETLRQLTSVDSGTNQAGVAAVAEQVERFAKGLGADVQRVTPANNVIGPNLVVTFKGTGQRRIMLMAHMDTVYVAGTAAARPFRLDGNRAIAPGIGDDKGGVAVFLHAMKLLKARGFADYERVTLVFNSDEEQGSFGSRDLIRSQASRHDVILSGESSGPRETLVIGTSGAGGLRVVFRRGDRMVEEASDTVLRTRELFTQVPETRMNWTIARVEDTTALKDAAATITWRIKGRPSHAGVTPHLGINAVVEGALLVKRVTQAAATMPGVRLQWRALTGGQVSNIIPDQGLAQVEIAAPNVQEAAAALAQVGSQPGLPGAQVTVEVTPGPAPAGSGGDVFASADIRVPTPEAFATLTKIVRDRVEEKKFASTSLAASELLAFPPYNMNAQARAIAETVIAINRQLGGELEIGPRAFGATDAAWAGQSGKPVLEGFGLPGANYHSSDEEYIFADRIPRRLALVAETIRAISRMEGK